MEKINRGDIKVPLFFTKNFKAEVSELVDATLKKMSHLYLIDLTTGADKSIKIVLDGDPEVHLEDCIKFSRSIEHQLDPEKHDFAIEVSSAGVGNCLLYTSDAADE